jgi:oligogalacturonide lyase
MSNSGVYGIGARFPSEMRTMIDMKTGVSLNVLTSSNFSDAKIYQDHPQWSHDGQWIIFRSTRGNPDGKFGQAFAVNEITGSIVQLTDFPGLNVGTLNIARLSGLLYYLRQLAPGKTALMELKSAEILTDSASGSMKPATYYERPVAFLPDGWRESGGFALDATEKCAYLGAREMSDEEKRGETLPPTPAGQCMRQFPSSILSIDLATGETKTVVETPFLMGHVQTNPWVPGEIVFCNETGGDAPQRMFTVIAGEKYRPLYVETPDEWVTHEAVVTKDEVMFSIMGHLERLHKKPSGLAVINLRTDKMKILGQCDVGNGFWHVNGSPDGRWAVGDDFDGNVHLINRATGKLTTITTGHVMKPDHAHATFSPDSSRILIQSGLLSQGKTLSLMVISIGSCAGLNP